MDDLLDQLRTRLLDGPVPWAGDGVPHVEFATVDAIRSFALGTGDDNPIYADPAIAAGRGRGGLVAPPLFLLATGTPIPLAGDGPDELQRRLQVGVSIRHERWHFLDVVRPGDRLVREDQLVSVVAGDDVRTPGATMEVTQRSTWRRAGVVVGERERCRVHGLAPTPPERRARATYTDDELDVIERAHDRHARRGPDTRRVDEVAPGERLPPSVRGPLTMTDLVTYRAAVGAGPLHAGVGRLAHRGRIRRPHLYSKDLSGAWDTIERLHWDEAYARSLGHTSAYDYSHTRPVWLSQYVTDWAGDGAWLADFEVAIPGANYLGDTHWLTGEVVSVDPHGQGAAVGLRLAATNQLGDVTCHADATVLLPERPTGCTGPGPHPDERI